MVLLLYGKVAAVRKGIFLIPVPVEQELCMPDVGKRGNKIKK